jgi:hypothetical protein
MTLDLYLFGIVERYCRHAYSLHKAVLIVMASVIFTTLSAEGLQHDGILMDTVIFSWLRYKLSYV